MNINLHTEELLYTSNNRKIIKYLAKARILFREKQSRVKTHFSHGSCSFTCL